MAHSTAWPRAAVLGATRAAVAAAVLFTANAASANNPTWYGYETLTVDGVSAGLIGVNSYLLYRDQSHGDNGEYLGVKVALAGLGGLGYVFGGPIVHWAHARTGIGFADLGTRIALPLGGLGLGALVSSGDQTRAIVVGAIVGGALAIALDAAVFAFDPVLGTSSSTTSGLTSAQRTRLFSIGGAF